MVTKVARDIKTPDLLPDLCLRFRYVASPARLQAIQPSTRVPSGLTHMQLSSRERVAVRTVFTDFTRTTIRRVTQRMQCEVVPMVPT
jgi:hypothetical protein